MEIPADIAAMGAWTHATLAHGNGKAIADRFQRDDWTCHRCGFRFHGYMEIDHVLQHGACGADGLRTICQFCHNLCHPVWAGIKGRLRLIWAPSMTQGAINRTAWLTMLASEDRSGRIIDQELAEAAREIALATQRRERVFASMLSASHPEGMIDALFALKALCGADRQKEVLSMIDPVARFWPVAADRILGHAKRPSESLSRWDGCGFIDLAGQAISDFWLHEQDIDAVRRLCAAHQADIAG